jgi:uncharacterized membrane protein
LDTNKDKSSNITTKDIAAKGSIIAVILTAPSLSAFFIGWYILDDLIQAAIIGGIVNFLAMGFSIKISKKLFVKKPHTSNKDKSSTDV